MKNELTIEQHFKNVEVAVVKAVGTYDQLQIIRSSFSVIKSHVEKLEKELSDLKTKESEIIKP